MEVLWKYRFQRSGTAGVSCAGSANGAIARNSKHRRVKNHHRKPRQSPCNEHVTGFVRYSQTMRANLTRERLAKGETVFGCGLQVYRSPEICRAFAAAGFD